jgi:hypothetical protein
MPSPDRVASISLALKCGAYLEYGCERVSTRISIPYPFNRMANSSAEWLECPIVKIDPRFFANH